MKIESEIAVEGYQQYFKKNNMIKFPLLLFSNLRYFHHIGTFEILKKL